MNLSTALKKCPGVRQVISGKRIGCFPVHSTYDVVSLRIGYQSANINPVEARELIREAFLHLGENDIQEAQFKGFSSWNNDQFCAAHPNGLDITVIDISGFDEEQRIQLVEAMTKMKICYFVPFRNKIFLPGSGDFMNQLQLALLQSDVHLPYGIKQGSFSDYTLEVEHAHAGIPQLSVSKNTCRWYDCCAPAT